MVEAERLEALERFKNFWDKLYGNGFEIINWHKNGETEPFDNIYDSALASMNISCDFNGKNESVEHSAEESICSAHCFLYNDFIRSGYNGCEKVNCAKAYKDYIQKRDEIKTCANCAHLKACGYFDSPDLGVDPQKAFEENCVGCCCGDGYECYKDINLSGCDNWEHVETPVHMQMG